jgi:hypothetical protein
VVELGPGSQAAGGDARPYLSGGVAQDQVGGAEVGVDGWLPHDLHVEEGYPEEVPEEVQTALSRSVSTSSTVFLKYFRSCRSNSLPSSTSTLSSPLSRTSVTRTLLTSPQVGKRLPSRHNVLNLRGDDSATAFGGISRMFSGRGVCLP